MDILNFREQPSGGKTVALFDVYIPALKMTLRKLKLLNGKKGLFIAFPAYAEGEEPNKTWIQYFSFEKDKSVEFMKQAMEALQPFLKP